MLTNKIHCFKNINLHSINNQVFNSWFPVDAIKAFNWFVVFVRVSLSVEQTVILNFNKSCLA